MQKNKKLEGWNLIFKKEGRRYLKPQEDMPAIAAFLKKSGVKKVLDIGCGSGRHTVMLAQKGFEVTGMDNAEEGLKLAKKWLKEKGLKAKLDNASCYERFPYPDNYFDAIVSVQVIHHNKIKGIRFCISEIKRVLRNKGIIFITMGKERIRMKRDEVKMIAPRTFVVTKGHEEGVAHYILNKKIIRKEFKDFSIQDFHLDSGGSNYCILAVKK
jgi:cyclopropane fatty-acyl-phospholipid synthase-like methyltransferase